MSALLLHKPEVPGSSPMHGTLQTFLPLVYDDIPLASGFYISFYSLTLIGLGFFDMFRFAGGGGGGGGGEGDAAPIIFVVCGPIARKFCTGVDNQSISSNGGKNCIKLNNSEKAC